MLPPQRLRRRWLVSALLLLFLGLEYWGYPYGQPMPGRVPARTEDGLWLHRSWVDTTPSDAQLAALCAHLRTERITWAYFHVRGVDHMGRLVEPCDGEAQRLVRTVHRLAPGVRCLAWIYAGNVQGRERVNLADPAVRKVMVGEARRLVVEDGFDGVQWDYEICPSGDPSLPKLLEETRTALPLPAVVSVATPLWLPAPLRRWGWGDADFRRVAARCDQIAVMGYDSAMPLPRAYTALMRAQVVHTTRAAWEANPRCRVIIGIPNYPDRRFSHNPHVETLENALRGVRAGLSDPQAMRASFSGVAIFADYTTGPADWRSYHRNWQ